MDGPALHLALATPLHPARDTPTPVARPTITMGASHERRTGLRPLVTGNHQLAGVHHLRVQLRQTAIATRLALVQRLFGFSGCAFHRDVRVPAHDLSVVGLVEFTLPGGGLDEPRCWSPVGDDVRLAHQSALRAVSRAELHLHRWRLLAALGLVAGSLSCATRAPPGDVRPLRADAPPAVRGLRAHHVWLPGAMANAGHLGHVPHPRHHVRVARQARGARREAEFGDAYRRYAAGTPAFFPRWGAPAPARHGNG